MRMPQIMVVIGTVALLTGVGSTLCLGAVPLDDGSMGVLRGGTCTKWVCSSYQTCQAPPCSSIGGSCVRCTGSASLYTCTEVQLFGQAHCRNDTPEPAGCGKIIPDATCWPDLEGYYKCQFGDPDSAWGICNRMLCTTWD